MTFAELKTETLRRAGEDPTLPRFYTAAEAGAAINAAQNVFAFLTLCLEDTANLTISAGAVLSPISSMAPRWIAPLRLEIDGQKLHTSNLAEFRALNPAWMDSTQRDAPTRYAMMGWEHLALFPVPAVQAVIVSRFASAPVTLSLDADVPQIPAEDHEAMVGFALLRLAMKEGAAPMAAAMPGFQEFLAAAKRRMETVRARSVELAYDTTPTERWITLMENPKWPLTLQP